MRDSKTRIIEYEPSHFLYILSLVTFLKISMCLNRYIEIRTSRFLMYKIKYRHLQNMYNICILENFKLRILMNSL